MISRCAGARICAVPCPKSCSLRAIRASWRRCCGAEKLSRSPEFGLPGFFRCSDAASMVQTRLTGLGSGREEFVLRKSVLVLAFSLSLTGLVTEARINPSFAAAAATAAEGPQTGKLEQVIPGHYIYSSGARISGVIATSEGVVVLDSLSNEAMAKHERQLIQST